MAIRIKANKSEKTTKIVPKKENKKVQLVDLNPGELQARVNELSTNLIKLRLEKSVGKLTNTRQIFNIRKEIARAKTLFTQKKQI